MTHRGDAGSEAPEIDGAMARRVADTMQALATPSRVRILAALGEQSRSVGELAEAIEMEQSAVSHQLRVLRHLRLVIGERRGRRVSYSLHDDHVAVLLREAVFHVEHLGLALGNAAATRPAEVVAR